MVFPVITSALLMAFASQPLGLSFLAFFGLVPILNIINNNTKLSVALKIGLIWGSVYASTVIFWLAFNVGTSTSVAFLTLILAVGVISIGYGMIFFLFGLSIKKTSHLFPLEKPQETSKKILSFAEIALGKTT